MDRVIETTEFIKIPAGATTAEEHDLRFPVIPPTPVHGLLVPSRRPQDILKGIGAGD